MGGGGPLPYKVPHWTKYKVGDHTPELQALEKKLAALGLKDPWIRNEVWRFDRGYTLSKWAKAKMLLSRGAVVGITLGVISAGISIAWEKEYSKQHAAHAPHGEH